MMRTLWSAMVFEVRTLLRTREVYTTALVPGLLFVPLLMLWLVLVISVILPSVEQRLALPVDAPLPVSAQASKGLFDTVTQVDDPHAALEAGDADAAIVSWTLSEAPNTPWVQVDAHADDDDAAQRLERFVERVARAGLDDRIEAAGGTRGVDRRLVYVKAPDVDDDSPIPGLVGTARRSVLLGWVVFVVSLSMLVLPLRTAADRIDGILEAWAVTSSGPMPLLVVRVFSASALFLLVSLLFPAALFRITPELPLALSLGVGDIVEVVLSILVANCTLVAAGLLSTSTRSANQLSGIAVTVMGAGTGLGLLSDDWPMVPMAGFGLSHDPLAQAVRLVGTLLVLVAAFAVLPWLARGPRVLPAGERDD